MGLFSKKNENNELDEENLIKKGKELGEQERYDEAIPYFDKALKINKNNLDARMGKGAAHQNRGKMLDMGIAMTQYQQACRLVEKEYEENKRKNIKTKPNTLPFYLLGGVYYEKKNKLFALKQYYKIIELDSEDIKAMAIINDLEKSLKKNR